MTRDDAAAGLFLFTMGAMFALAFPRKTCAIFRAVVKCYERPPPKIIEWIR